ncbi:MAG: hypothetical protein M1816_000833 [Peltula sp. TS41687]|nr:MAG: hypothetical protein M1816_000833 [Peltula sp. TS41687]
MATKPQSPPSTPGRSPPPGPEALPAIPEATSKVPTAPRRPSFSFLRRSKSGEGMSRRSTSGSKLSKKQRAQQQQQQQEIAPTSPSPPILPDLPTPPPINTFGAQDARPDSTDIVSNKYGSAYYPPPKAPPPSIPIPPIPGSLPRYKGESGGHESMTHRGRYSYASSMVSTINSPRRMRRRKDPTPFNILVIGAHNSGKTSFLNFLRTSLALPNKRRGQTRGEDIERSGPSMHPSAGAVHPTYTSQYLETEIDGERIGLTLWDSQGLEKNMVDLQVREMTSFLESKFEDTFTEEMKVIRAPGVQDTHIHCVFLILDPLKLDGTIAASKQRLRQNGDAINGKQEPGEALSGLEQGFEIQVLRGLQGKTTVVPVISKADTITTAHMTYLKRIVWDDLKRAKIDLLEHLGVEEDAEDEDEDHFNGQNSDSDGVATADDDDTSSSGSVIIKRANNPPGATANKPKTNNNNITKPPFLPLSILSPDIHDPGTIGRRFPWGFADPYDPDHCDFMRLKEHVFSDWRAELREASREVWYERWRTLRLSAGSRDGRRVEQR